MTQPQPSDPTIAIVGGTGSLGSALALRLARSGLTVVIGSRDAGKAVATAEEVRRMSGGKRVSGDRNETAADSGDIVVVTVPFSSQTATLEAILPAVAGKLVVDTTVPLVPPKVGRVQLPPAGCAAAICQQVIGESARVVSALHNVSADKLAADGPLACDVLVFGNSADDREELICVLDRTGMRGLHGGPLVNSAAAEAMTSVLISINRRYGVSGGAGIRITGVEPEPIESTPAHNR